MFKVPLLLVIFSLFFVCFFFGKLSVHYYKQTLNISLNPIGMGVYKKDNLLLKMQAKVKGEKRAILFGDSRIALWENLPTLNNILFINRGIGGETSAQLLLRLEKDVLLLSPDMVIIQIGINDLKAMGVFEGRSAEILRNTKNNIKSILLSLDKLGIRVFILTILPTGKIGLFRSFVWSSDIEQSIVSMNDFIRTLALKNITVIDCDPIFRVGNKLNPKFSLDDLHLNNAGYSALSQLLKREMNNVLSPMPG